MPGENSKRDEKPDRAESSDQAEKAVRDLSDRLEKLDAENALISASYTCEVLEDLIGHVQDVKTGDETEGRSGRPHAILITDLEKALAWATQHSL